MSCHFCFNAHVWAKLPHDEEDYFGEGLHDDNDGSSCGIGYSVPNYKIYFNSGMGVPCNIEVSRWHPENGWCPVSRYYPKFCPECGRKLDEYQIDERGTSYKRKEKVV
jgi:hypothetical protein